MPKLFDDLREQLLRAGIAPRHVRRYVRELNEHLSDLTEEERAAGRNSEEAQSAALARLGNKEHLASAMIGRREFQSWSAHVPWLTFGVGPLCVLSAAYFAACFILWSGWKIFLPATTTPFIPTSGPVYGLENIYFQTGRMIYFGAPLVIGLAISVTAVRQRLRAFWPILGLILIALIGSTAVVHAQRPSLFGAGHVSMTLVVVPSVRGISEILLRACFVFLLASGPYLFWRIKENRSREFSS